MAQDSKLDADLIKGNQVPVPSTLPQCQVPSDIAQLQQQVDRLPERLMSEFKEFKEELKEEFKRLEGQLRTIESSLVKTEQLLPMRLINSGATHHANLVYPPGIAVHNFPSTKNDICSLSVNECVKLAGLLGLPDVGGPGEDVDVRQRRQQIANYLGCAMVFEGFEDSFVSRPLSKNLDIPSVSCYSPFT